MGKLSDVCLQKSSKSKRHAREEKKKLSVEKENPAPEPEVAAVDPAVPKVSRMHRKKEARKSKGIVIVEGTGTPGQGNLL